MKHSACKFAIVPLFFFHALTSVGRVNNHKIVSHLDEAASRVIPEEVRYVIPPVDSALFTARTLDEIINSIGNPTFRPTPINKVLGPWIFSGYHNLAHRKFDTTLTPYIDGLTVLTNDSTDYEIEEIINESEIGMDEERQAEPLTPEMTAWYKLDSEKTVNPDVDFLSADITPRWLRDALTSYRIQEDFMYSNMVSNPSNIDFAYWDLPVPPRLPDDDISFASFIRKMNLPDIEVEKAVLPEEVINKIHWLHAFNAAMQFSQAYVSSNWYQGGNNNLSLLFNVNWNVQLNQVYHPNLMFQSNLQYKLGLNSTPQDKVHKYSISEDVLQYNLNTGLKAFKKWFYSFNLQFKTQIFNNYLNNSTQRKASFLSPGDFNLGLGMSYTTKKHTWQLTATISPLSYNLKTCITDKIDHSQFNIRPDRKSHSEIGSNSEVNLTWKIAWNIDYKTRLFLFTDYSYFLADWEHTINFSINKFLSTQLYIHLRQDSSSELDTKWRHFMLREVLSFGLSYTFSTKP